MTSGNHKVETRKFHGRVRVMTAGHLIADSTDAVELSETGYPAVYYIPKNHIRMEFFTRSNRTTECPYKGTASYWSIPTATGKVTDAAWSYEDPLDEVADIKGHLAFDPMKIDAIESTTA